MAKSKVGAFRRPDLEEGYRQWLIRCKGDGYLTEVTLFNSALFIEREYKSQLLDEGYSDTAYYYKRDDDGMWRMESSGGGDIVFDADGLPVGLCPYDWGCILPLACSDGGVEELWNSFLQAGEGSPENIFSEVVQEI